MKLTHRLDPITFNQKIKNHAIIIDVRTAKEFEKGAIHGALNFDYFKRDFIHNFNDLDKSEPLYIYCRSGFRSHKALKKLICLGFEQVYDLKGGYLAWKKI